MIFIIRNVGIITHDISSAFISKITMRVSHPYDLKKYCDLVAIPMHRLYFILNLKGVIFSKFNDRDHGAIRKNLKACLELLVIPLCEKNNVLQKTIIWISNT